MTSLTYELYRAGSAATDAGLHEWLRHFLTTGGPLVVLLALGRKLHLTARSAPSVATA
jgi:hypothetical protein